LGKLKPTIILKKNAINKIKYSEKNLIRLIYIGTTGANDRKYLAHLHFEIRDDISKGMGGGYSRFSIGYLKPTKFIKANR
jgi:hypothetical protein